MNTATPFSSNTKTRKLLIEDKSSTNTADSINYTMLAAHRDQENLVHSHQAPAKQQHKTPGARFPKTPSRYPQHDENAPTAFAGKTALGGASKFGGEKTIMKAPGTRQALVTPMGTCTS